MELTVQQGWKPGDVRFLCKNLHPMDKKECRFHTWDIHQRITQLAHDMGDNVISIHDDKGRLWWLGGISPANNEEYPDGGYAWLLKTKYAKPQRKAERKVMREALHKVLQMVRDKTDYERIANVIWDQQKVNLRWLESEGFIINYKQPFQFTKPNGESGIFYQFCKVMR